MKMNIYKNTKIVLLRNIRIEKYQVSLNIIKGLENLKGNYKSCP